VRTQTKKKRKMHDFYMLNDHAPDEWEELDEVGYSARRELVEKEIRRRIKTEAKKRRERLKVGALARGNFLSHTHTHTPPHPTLSPFVLRGLTAEWAFMQSKLTIVLHEADRLEVATANHNEGGEECEAILTAIRRAKRRGALQAAYRLSCEEC
jgi:hypothetical protein